ncbi:MAG: CRISPR-associated helicase Cas3', partial [Tepidisphaeraceae bacterium]
MQAAYLGHSENAGGLGTVELLRDHIRYVTDRAAGFSSAFGAAEQARIAGLLHDLGKYADPFQRRVRGDGAGRDHATIGAIAALRSYKGAAILPALAIGGHHVGLPDFEPNWRGLVERLQGELHSEPAGWFTSADANPLLERYAADGLALPPPPTAPLLPTDEASAADLFDVRMLFSCLVDADFLETEAHFEGDAHTPRRPRAPGPLLDVDQALAALERRLQRFANPENDVDRARAQLLEACTNAAKMPLGPFTLTAPTGAGKTLAMLAFALNHARAHGLRRIVLVMPFLNIIEQTARVYREIFSGFPEHFVLEHHSLVRDDASEPTVDDEASSKDGKKKPFHRLLAENWDAPIVLTTSVQCLESMMAWKPSACRKLHRLARSVILFDEVQTLPPHLAKATLANLSRLSDPAGPYRSSVLLATATQPAFDSLDAQVRPFASSGWKPCEINPHAPAMFQIAAQRSRVRWRHGQPIPGDTLARELARHDQVLCIVNLKRHTEAIVQAMQSQCDRESLIHLSTQMCPAHRIETLARVRARLDAGSPCRLISTQCVEAGVDLDLPVVYRAMAPLDSLCQAAGRCNRHGLRAAPGEFIVFDLDDEKSKYPPGYATGVNATLTWLNGLPGDLDSL